MNLKKSLAKIKLLALDFDGVLTDGYVYFSQDGHEQVRCSRKDGLAVHLLQKHDVAMHVISKEANPVVTERCKKMGIACDQSVEKGEGKAEILVRVAKQLGLVMDQVAFMGDDLNDVAALKAAGVAITVADGHPEAKKLAHLITAARGGEHAVREVVERILEAKGVQLLEF